MGLRPAGSKANDVLAMKYIKETVQKMVKKLGQQPINVQIECPVHGVSIYVLLVIIIYIV